MRFYLFNIPALLAAILLAGCAAKPPAKPAVSAANTVAPAATVPATNSPALTAAQIKDRCEDLGYLAMRSDADARDTILAEMRNPVADIRKAALSAAIQFGDRSIVPGLRDAVDATTNLEEKVEILKAIDYINLPSLTEYRAALRKSQATGQPFSLPGATPVSTTTNSAP